MLPVIATATGRATLCLRVLGFGFGRVLGFARALGLGGVLGFVRRRGRSALGVAGTGLLRGLRVGLDALVELRGRNLAVVLRRLGRGLPAGGLGEHVFGQIQ